MGGGKDVHPIDGASEFSVNREAWSASRSSHTRPPSRPGMPCRLCTPQVSPRPAFSSSSGDRKKKPRVEIVPAASPTISAPVRSALVSNGSVPLHTLGKAAWVDKCVFSSGSWRPGQRASPSMHHDPYNGRLQRLTGRRHVEVGCRANGDAARKARILHGRTVSFHQCGLWLSARLQLRSSCPRAWAAPMVAVGLSGSRMIGWTS